MPAPIIKRGRVILASSDPCPKCNHLVSAHDEAKARQCGTCACVAQDVNNDPRKGY